MSENEELTAEETVETVPEANETPQDLPETNTDTPENGETADDIETNQNEELAKVKQEAEKNMAGWQRTLAEFQNYKRRVEREQKDLRQRAAVETVTQMLPIIDDFERALNNIPKDFEGNPWMNGVELIQGKFNRLLEENDIEIIDPVGEAFDPNHHQAVSRDDSDDVESDHVIETLLKGYVSGNVLLRPALVRIAN
jgi:molecular chaperone GrpE